MREIIVYCLYFIISSVSEFGVVGVAGCFKSVDNSSMVVLRASSPPTVLSLK